MVTEVQEGKWKDNLYKVLLLQTRRVIVSLEKSNLKNWKQGQV